jgi:hypothetical protein
MTTTQFFQRDANHVPITNLGLTATKSITYSALTTGATGATTLFTVTGTVRVNIFAVCTVDLTGSGTIEVGISGNTAALIAQTTGTAIDAGEVWVDTAPATVEAPLTDKILTNGTDIIQTIGTDTLTAGSLTYYVTWTPISEDGNLVAA